jgi:uncharacterized protein (DUF697 family)
MSEHETAANELVTHYSKWGFGAGCIPVPLADLAAVTGVQLRMLTRMSALYEVPFSENRAKSIISALLGALVSTKLGWGAGYMVASMFKSVPVLGSILGIGTVGTFAGASTYAVGKVFIRHFEAGGTFLTLDAEKAKAYFHEQYEKGVDAVKGAKASKPAAEKDATGAAATA